MKINIVELNKNKDFDLEIIFINSLDEIIDSKDKNTLEQLEFKAKDEVSTILVESKKIYVGFEEYSYDSL
ncbi:leucyl aminopeptidase, partial [Aliarcobacter lanthieri]